MGLQVASNYMEERRRRTPSLCELLSFLEQTDDFTSLRVQVDVVEARARGETATVFLPSVPSLLSLAAELESERDHVLGRPAEGLDDEALADHIRDNVAGMFHVAGTCKMGAANDPDAVVDNAGRVRGFEGLRVVDASIMPTVPRANTNIPTIMVAEKISAAITAQ